ncbi:thioesterase II family protein [Streptomyces sp.]|uniref:thioesterase II family protein n=1 Tax=Streptomyces sp. TaxID=1931 RepID=UPI002D22734D|nr:alpha/beta fold hydrolase [Streptomyces sp.]HZF89092.1 alpha/beta fold hydrolase [Streptomyces sp.]
MSSVVFPLSTGHRAPEPPPDGLPLVAVPHAGGTAHAFRGWTAQAHQRGLTVWGTRTAMPNETPAGRTVRDRARALAESLAALDRPYVLVGHSLGGTVAAEAVLRLERHAPEAVPALLVVCGTNPSHLPRPAALPDGSEADAVEFLRTVGGTPAQVLEDRGMRELAVAMLLHDLSSLRGYRWDGSRLTTPTAVYAGRTDPVAPPESLARWAEIAEPVTTRVFGSGHFFPHDRTAEVLDAIRLDLARHRPADTVTHPHSAPRP